MAPKKKRQTTSEQPLKSQEKPITPETKKQQAVKQNIPTNQPEVTKQITPVQKPAQKKQTQNQPVASKSTEELSKKILLEDTNKMTEQERIQLRKLRFQGIGTDTTLQEAERIKQERLKKFGGMVKEDEETLQKRKEKFSTAEDQLAKKRLEKFGGTTITEEKNVIEERKKKFGSTEDNINLDDEINKSKHIKKFHPKHNRRFNGGHRQ